MNQDPTVVPGPPITPPADLLAWFEGDGGEALVQVPVVVAISPLGVGRARVALVPDTEGLPLKLDDSRLGIALADRLREHCAGSPCAVWIEGRWGSAMPGPGLDLPDPGGESAHPFAVERVVGPVQPEDAPRVRVVGR